MRNCVIEDMISGASIRITWNAENACMRDFYNPGESVELIYVSRMRTQEDKRRVR